MLTRSEVFLCQLFDSAIESPQPRIIRTHHQKSLAAIVRACSLADDSRIEEPTNRSGDRRWI